MIAAFWIDVCYANLSAGRRVCAEIPCASSIIDVEGESGHSLHRPKRAAMYRKQPLSAAP
jgi:hypothetical protein